MAEKDRIEKFLAALKITRQQEADAFAIRIQDQHAMVDGITAVLEVFEKEAVSGSAELDADAVAKVKAALLDVQNSIKESIKSDTAAEDSAIAKYDTFVAKQNARIKAIDTKVGTLKGEIAVLNARLEQIVDELETQNKIIQNQQKIIDNTTVALKALNTQY